MGWQSETEIARLYLSYDQKKALIAKIQRGKNGRAFIRNMATIFSNLPQQGSADSWGDQAVSSMSGPKRATDIMWEAVESILSLPCARAHLNVKEIDFSDGHPAAGGTWEKWLVFDSANLHSFLQECEDDMPEDMRNVLRTAHEHDDGWETIVIKHTVV